MCGVATQQLAKKSTVSAPCRFRRVARGIGAQVVRFASNAVSAACVMRKRGFLLATLRDVSIAVKSPDLTQESTVRLVVAYIAAT